MDKSLPTAPGSIITFRSDFETPGDPMLYCATLLIESVDLDGHQLNPVWSTGDYSPYEENGYGFSESFSESFLLEQDFTPLYMDPDSGEVAEALWTNSDGYVPNFNQAESIFLVCRAKSSLI